MRRRLFYIVTLLVLFLLWGVFGITAGLPRGEASAQSALPSPDNSTVNSVAGQQAMIPVTGSATSEVEILIFYALSGLGALIFILAMLGSANRSTVLYSQHKKSSSGEASQE